MENATGVWLAELMLANLESLTWRAVTTARAQVPWYRSVDGDRLYTLFAAAYTTLATVFPASDITPMRQYMERAITERLRQGAPAEGLIQVATLLEAGVQDLIDRERWANPARAADATRQVMLATKNMRLILSGINLRLLSKLPDLPPHQ